MAEDVVVKEQLSLDMIEAGAELTMRLENAGVPISAAFWFFESEINEWRPNSELVQLLKIGVPTGPGISRRRFSKNVINGHFIEDALIYRAT